MISSVSQLTTENSRYACIVVFQCFFAWVAPSFILIVCHKGGMSDLVFCVSAYLQLSPSQVLCLCTPGCYGCKLSLGSNLGSDSRVLMYWFWLKPDNACIVRLKFWRRKSCTSWQSMHLPTISKNIACFWRYGLNVYLLGCGGKKHGLNILTIDVIQPISLLKPNLTCFFQKYDFTGSKG